MFFDGSEDIAIEVTIGLDTIPIHVQRDITVTDLFRTKSGSRLRLQNTPVIGFRGRITLSLTQRINSNDLMPLLVRHVRGPHLDDSLAVLGRILRMEHFLHLFQCAIFRLDEEEVYDSGRCTCQ